VRISDLRALRDKYERMLALRIAHEGDDEPDPRAALAALANEFPGALREIDDLERRVIEERIASLLRAEGGAPVERWMEAQLVVHRLARGALAAKRWLGKRRAITTAHREAFLEAVDGRELPFEAAEWSDDLARIARPPRGRIMDLVYTRAAAALDTSIDEIRVLAFGPKRKH
jgi:hypothetical protein